GGFACIMTLNEGGVLYKLGNLLRNVGFPSVFVRLYDPHHVNHFSNKSLEHLFTNNGGFKLEKSISHNTRLAAIDVPATSLVKKVIMKLGVAGVFVVGKIINKTYLQTIIVSKVE
ncbi:MAG: hypothetical protein JZU65_09035, partial [Chlorobium sp.]|nr:hypothetical protein [Chlorobium sp.]